jgi:hypothetical protein
MARHSTKRRGRDSNPRQRKPPETVLSTRTPSKSPVFIGLFGHSASVGVGNRVVRRWPPESAARNALALAGAFRDRDPQLTTDLARELKVDLAVARHDRAPTLWVLASACDSHPHQSDGTRDPAGAVPGRAASSGDRQMQRLPLALVIDCLGLGRKHQTKGIDHVRASLVPRSTLTEDSRYLRDRSDDPAFVAVLVDDVRSSRSAMNQRYRSLGPTQPQRARMTLVAAERACPGQLVSADGGRTVDQRRD